MSIELKPCPACSDPSPEISNTGDAYYVVCPRCCMRGPEAGGPTWAAEAWNAMPRALRWTKELREEVESLRREVENLSGQADRLAGWARMKCDEVKHLDREADWLADQLKQHRGPTVTYKGVMMTIREAARKAVESSHED